MSNNKQIKFITSHEILRYASGKRQYQLRYKLISVSSIMEYFHIHGIEYKTTDYGSKLIVNDMIFDQTELDHVNQVVISSYDPDHILWFRLMVD